MDLSQLPDVDNAIETIEELEREGVAIQESMQREQTRLMEIDRQIAYYQGAAKALASGPQHNGRVTKAAAKA
jgi:hypothetical protein